MCRTSSRINCSMTLFRTCITGSIVTRWSTSCCAKRYRRRCSHLSSPCPCWATSTTILPPVLQASNRSMKSPIWSSATGRRKNSLKMKTINNLECRASLFQHSNRRPSRNRMHLDQRWKSWSNRCMSKAWQHRERRWRSLVNSSQESLPCG